MTDTTDIKALRVEIAELRLEIANGYDRFIPETKIHIKLLERILDQLESERQRAERAEQALESECDIHIDTQQSMREWKSRAEKADSRLHEVSVHCANVEAKLAELKGEQVPVGVYNQHLFNLEGSAVLFSIGKSVEAGFVSESGELTRHHAYLFTAPQNPVVLPKGIRWHHDSEFEYLCKEDVVEAIEATGGIVKDGE